MILTGAAIADAVSRGAIVIDPFDPALLNPNSYNYRLGEVLKVFESQVVDPKLVPRTRKIQISQEGYVFEPGKLYLGSTVETIGSAHFVPSLIGRSSIGRLGVFLQVSADLGNLGAVHRWTLEIVVCQPVRLYAGMRIGQVSFWQPTGEIALYSGLFDRFSDAKESIPRAFEAHATASARVAGAK